MSVETVAIMRRGFEAMAASDYEVWLGMTSPAIKVYPRPEEPGVRDCYEGFEEMMEYLVNWFSSWKEYTIAAERFIDAGEYVIVDVKEVGVAEQSELRIEENFAHAFKLEDDKVVEWRMFGPVSEALEALQVEERPPS
jgi:ketosteroid isomerase-like protein